MSNFKQEDSVEEILIKMSKNDGNTEAIHAGSAFLQFKLQEKLLKDQEKRHKEFLIQQDIHNKRLLFWTMILSIAAIGSLFVSLFAYQNVFKNSEILNRPYVTVDPSGLEELNIGKIKSSLDDFSEQLIKKQVNFVIENTGQSPAAFQVDLSELEEVGVVEVIPQQNTEGIIFPGESKEVKYLLEIHSSFPLKDSEKKEREQYLKRLQSVVVGDLKYLSRITVTYDYLDKKGEGKYKTFIDQKLPRLNFSENTSARIDGYGFIWTVSFDSE